MKLRPRRIMATMLLLVAIFGMVMSFSESVSCADEPPDAHKLVSISHDHETQQVHSNNVPSGPSHSTDDHTCLDDCGCPCHAPLLNVSVVISNSQPFTYLFPVEKTLYIPEVYLSLFVPPDSSTV
jgi:hypothetical protein